MKNIATRGLFAAAALLGGTFMGITALGFIYARDITQGDPRRSLAFMTAAFGLGQMIGPTFAGVTYRFGDSFLLPSLVATVALLVAAGLAMTLYQESERFRVDRIASATGQSLPEMELPPQRTAPAYRPPMVTLPWSGS